ncbi:UvrABC system protein A (plasmid) [Roseivivax sp. THAF40]|uniref:ATP-binding cassette domain-containing protein n=1 Tax=Roseivivax sp. THAF40 TaxID=2587858 RepID=UPI001268634C|nr:excinuclease ABC subunit UvrA [Roseivivax sp. THAF40]QFT48994.1 UvrABC system protein A [Roseivivax sp. THAF40]
MTDISIRGARQNNLKDVDIDIPRNRIVVFTGVSGSGKSSLVFETINAEAQRQLYGTFSTFVQGKLPRIPKPDVDLIENVSPAIVLQQKRNVGGSRSTVGTTSEIYTYLRLLFSRVGEPVIGASTNFSFNSPDGMCLTCNGSGQTMQIELDKIIDPTKSLNDGAILFSEFYVDSIYWKFYAGSGLFDNDLPLDQYPPDLYQKLLYGEPEQVVLGNDPAGLTVTYEGVITKINRLYVHKNFDEMSDRKRRTIEAHMAVQTCETCKGARLNQAALEVTINGKNIDTVSHYEIDQLIEFVDAINDPRAEMVVDQIRQKSQHLAEIGLSYLSLSRQLGTLSGGEAQRVKLANQLGSSLTEMLYIMDEPSTGLHARDVSQLNRLLKKLRDRGNTVLVVEHDPDVIEIADHVIDVGPKAGVHGGRIMFEGSYSELLASDSLTGRGLTAKPAVKESFRPAKGHFPIRDARSHNLKGVDVDIPKGVFVCVTGVAGSGKSSIINTEFLKQHPEAITVDQSGIGRSSRSNAMTYTGAFDDIRRVFAETNRVSAKLFSFNSKGACPRCKGLGYTETEMAFLDPVKTTCEECEGKRYSPETLSHLYKGRSIADVLDLSVEEAIGVFDDPDIRQKLELLREVGLGYLTLGQPLSTLSGGECQRVKLSSELHKSGNIYVLDEPTTGLHVTDVAKIVEIIEKLTDRGNSVIVIEHNLDVIMQADWIIDIGPDGGRDGGELVFEGTPQQMIHQGRTATSEFLRRYAQ